jgi:hypothetical protein
MYAINCTKEDLEKALEAIQEKYDHNIRWNREPEKKGKRYMFTLTVGSSFWKGGRRGHTGRRIHAACWHVHGDFFEALFQVNPKAEIISRGNGTKITNEAGNWQDWNIGSIMSPMMYSEACDC